MGNFEKLVVLTVLFLSAIVLAVSLSQDDGEPKGRGPLDEVARVEDTVRSKPTDVLKGRKAPESTLSTPARKTRALTPAAAPGEPRDSEGARPEDRSRGSNAGSATPAVAGPDSSAPAQPSAQPSERKPSFVLDAGGEVTEAAAARSGSPARNASGLPRILLSSRGLRSSQMDDYKLYTVNGGDTWSALAQRFYGDETRARNLRLANDDLDEPVQGREILVPVYDLAEEAGIRAALRPEARPAGASTSAAAPGETYEVVSGDSLSGISLKVYQTSAHWKAIFEANRDQLESPDRLKLGMKLKLPAVVDLVRSSDAAATTAAKPDGPRVR